MVIFHCYVSSPEGKKKCLSLVCDVGRLALKFRRIKHLLNVLMASMSHAKLTYPLVMTNIAMGNGPFIDGLPIKNGGSFHGELLVITRW